MRREGGGKRVGREGGDSRGGRVRRRGAVRTSGFLILEQQDTDA